MFESREQEGKREVGKAYVTLAPILWPIPTMGWIIAERKMLTMWRRSRLWSYQDTERGR